MTPARSIVHQANTVRTVTDARGRKIVARRLTALDTLRLFKVAGPILAQNEPWLSLAGLAFAVLEIDSVPVPPPATEPQIESLINRLGEDGLAAIAEVMAPTDASAEPMSNVGN